MGSLGNSPAAIYTTYGNELSTYIHCSVSYSLQSQGGGMDRLLLRPVEAAEAIGIGRSKVYELLASGELPSIRVGGSVRVPLEALRAWIDRQLVQRTEAP